MTDVVVSVTPQPDIVISVGDFGPLTAATIRAKLEAGTPAAVALDTGVAVVVASWLADSYQSRGGSLVLVKDDGSTIRRTLLITQDGTSGGDATAANIQSSGIGAHADISSTAILAAVSGTGASQVINLTVTAAASGSSWNATFYPDFLKTATP